ncbi:hypothetical protein DFR70_102341 [Nocardia tenerifensis]|uniref:Co-chaperone DjlA N-terminal domain-containing protein n=1 Tax=Nocardia tenerifensis TaxID=228006 RepID=A0A318KJT7_9NOCA|nr:hypothetical protein [Nocardia tenerifensis]PXX68657.1 hypothetical protein DFR70_102341 [Nocardia tenerifensis]
MSEQMLPVSDFGREAYGISGAPRQAMINYGRVLMAIAGADGEVSKPEYDWLVAHQRKFGATEDILAEYEDFDYRSADLGELLAEIKVDVETWSSGPHLIYHAIQMCGADGVYADAERAKVAQAAKDLAVPSDVVLTLEALIAMEKAVYNMRAAIFHIHTLD